MQMLSDDEWQAIVLTVQLALYTMLLLLVIATPLAWWLCRPTKYRLAKSSIEALITLPLVLPPTVLGFYLLLLLGPHSEFATFLQTLDLSSLAFSFQGILLASLMYSLPFAVQPLQQAFSELDKRQLEVAASLGASSLDRWFSIILPQCKSGLVVAASLSFAHTLGEFGVVLMLGGSIPGETKVLSIVIYEYAEAMNYQGAARLSGMLLAFSWLLLLLVQCLRPSTPYNREHR